MSFRRGIGWCNLSRLRRSMRVSAIVLAGCRSPQPAPMPELPATRVEVAQLPTDPDTSKVTALAISGDSRRLIAVLQSWAGRVTIVAGSGEMVEVFGSRGLAREQFGYPEAMGWRGDSLWVWDRSKSRVTWHTVDGRVLGEQRFEETYFGASEWFSHGGRAMRNGAFLLEPSLKSGRARPSLGGTGMPVGIRMADGSVRTPAWVPFAGPWSVDVAATGGRTAHTFPPFDTRPLMEVAPSGTWLIAVDRLPASSASGDSLGQLRVLRFDEHGDSLPTMVRMYRPIRVGQFVIDSLEARYHRWADPQDDPPFSLAAYLEATWLPDNLPPVDQALPFDEGVWLRREPYLTAQRWQRISFNGGEDASVLLPTSFLARWADSWSIWGVEGDSDGRTLIVRYDVSQGAGL